MAAAVQALACCEKLYVLGSASLLPVFPQLGGKDGFLGLSYDADFLIFPCEESVAAMVHEAVGEGSLFAEKNGYHADILRPDIQSTLPLGWESRLVPVGVNFSLRSLDPLDLMVVKLQTGRVKDLELIGHVLDLGLFVKERICQHLDSIPWQESEVLRCYQRLDGLKEKPV
ncbi:MAG: hypothetical protein HC904_14330 [Blastochloris sp.]|nr:hypothetical protein [Blastochloris sp.]